MACLCCVVTPIDGGWVSGLVVTDVLSNAILGAVCPTPTLLALSTLYFVPSGPVEVQCGRETRTRGQNMGPKMIAKGPKTLLGGCGIPMFLVPFAACLGAGCGPVRSGSILSHLGPRRPIAGGKCAFWAAKEDP